MQRKKREVSPFAYVRTAGGREWTIGYSSERWPLRKNVLHQQSRLVNYWRTSIAIDAETSCQPS